MSLQYTSNNRKAKYQTALKDKYIVHVLNADTVTIALGAIWSPTVSAKEIEIVTLRNSLCLGLKAPRMYMISHES